jgi:hypothetical protein
LNRLIAEIWSAINSPFWLTHTEVVREGDRVFRIEYIARAPGAPAALLQFGFSAVYYTVLGIPVTAMLNQGFTLSHWPAMLVLAANSTLRFIVKYHERISQHIDWPYPVGRESRLVLGVMVLIGAFAGFCAGLWADHLVFGGLTNQGLGFAFLLAFVEGMWNARRVGGGRAYGSIEPPPVEIRRVQIMGPVGP